MALKVPNPVPRVRHPDWLHKKMLEKNDTYKQRRITDIFSRCSNPANDEPSSSGNKAPHQELTGFGVLGDIEDVGGNKTSPTFKRPVVNVTKRKRTADKENPFSETELDKTWREVLGNPPAWGSTKVQIYALQHVVQRINQRYFRKATKLGYASRSESGCSSRFKRTWAIKANGRKRKAV